MTNLRFDELSLSDEVLKAIIDMGFEEATPIQSQAIPFALDGRDILGQAQTGTGKTAAFAIPVIEKIDVLRKVTQSLILCPTRELAVQISNEIKKLAKYIPDLFVATIYGGDSYDKQLFQLKKGAQIVVGTPGRVIDHLTRGTLKTAHISMMVLDEADEMLNMGFREDIEHILQQMPKEERQTLLFSATMSPEILNIARNYQNKPEQVRIARSEVTAANIEQLYVTVKQHQKTEAMCRLIEYYGLNLMLVFCNTKMQVDNLVDDLQKRGLNAEGLHGDMKQAQRNMVMGRFRSNTVNILIATDVAARGIDVTGVDAVFNYDLPQDYEYYVHRIGRTGRAGKKGISLTLTTAKEKGRLMDVERFIKAKINKIQVPDVASILEKRQENFVEKVKLEADSGHLGQYNDMIAKLELENLDSRKVIAALMRLYLGDLQQNLTDMDFTEEKERTRSNDRYERSNDRGNDRSPSRYGDRNSSRGSNDRENNRYGNKDKGKEKFTRNNDQKMTRLFVGVGRKQNISKADIVGSFAAKTGMSGRSIGEIEIMENFTFVEVPEREARNVVSVMHNNSIKGQKATVEIAK
jgi:ATP-dependent RNA helicase DeaD